MSEQTMKSFLSQFTTSKERIKNEWPEWMQDSAKVATASFPKPPHSGSQKSPPLGVSRKNK